MNQFLASHASHDVVQSAAVVDADGVDGAVAIDNYEKPVSSVISMVQKKCTKHSPQFVTVSR